MALCCPCQATQAPTCQCRRLEETLSLAELMSGWGSALGPAPMAALPGTGASSPGGDPLAVAQTRPSSPSTSLVLRVPWSSACHLTDAVGPASCSHAAEKEALLLRERNPQGRAWQGVWDGRPSLSPNRTEPEPQQ